MGLHHEGNHDDHPRQGAADVPLQQQREEDYRQRVEHEIEAIESGGDDPIKALREDRGRERHAQPINERRHPGGWQFARHGLGHRVINLPVLAEPLAWVNRLRRGVTQVQKQKREEHPRPLRRARGRCWHGGHRYSTSRASPAMK